MHKDLLAAKIAEQTNLSKADVIRVLDAARDVSSAEVASGGEVRLKGWMTISSVEVAARPGRNPKTGEAITIAAHRRVKFKAHEGYGV